MVFLLQNQPTTELKDTFLGAEGFNLETGLACASLSITPLPRRCYNYSGVNSLPVRRKPNYLQPVCEHQLLAKGFPPLIA